MIIGYSSNGKLTHTLLLEVGCPCNKYLNTWTWIWNWKTSRGWKKVEKIMGKASNALNRLLVEVWMLTIPLVGTQQEVRNKTEQTCIIAGNT